MAQEVIGLVSPVGVPGTDLAAMRALPLFRAEQPVSR
jgi:hypothetical protein